MKGKIEDHYTKHMRRLDEIYGKDGGLSKVSMVDNSHSKLVELRKVGRKMVQRSTFIIYLRKARGNKQGKSYLGKSYTTRKLL